MKYYHQDKCQVLANSEKFPKNEEMLKQVAEAHLCTSFHFVLWELLCSSILFNVPVQDLKVSCTFFLKDLSSVVSTCKKTVEMCCIGSSFAIFQMIWKLTIPSLSSWWLAVYYTAVEGVSGFESKAGELNQPWGVTIEMKASEQLQGVGGVLPMMAYTGRLRPKGIPF